MHPGDQGEPHPVNPPKDGEEGEFEGGDFEDADFNDGAFNDANEEDQPQENKLSIPEEVEREREEAEKKRFKGLPNPHLAPRAFGLEGRYVRALAGRFARMVSKVAEDSADLPVEGDDEWDFAELITRRFTGRMVSQCRMTREKRKVVIVLDTSPSCESQARLFAAVARIAEDMGDCELYDAPNFTLNAKKENQQWVRLPPSQTAWDFKGRVVLAFGDFDGLQIICEASKQKHTKIYWFCSEERKSALELNRNYFVTHFQGHYFPAPEMHALMKAMAKVR